jgi:hypothetical protein
MAMYSVVLVDPVVDGIQVHKVTTTSQNKSSNVWLYDTVYTCYTLHLEPTHLHRCCQ